MGERLGEGLGEGWGGGAQAYNIIYNYIKNCTNVLEGNKCEDDQSHGNQGH